MPSVSTSKRYVGIESYSPLATEIVQNAALRRKLYARTLLEMGTEKASRVGCRGCESLRRLHAF